MSLAAVRAQSPEWAAQQYVRAGEHRAMMKAAQLAFTLRLGLWFLLVLTSASMYTVSRDIYTYEKQARAIAEELAAGTRPLSSWIDEGWFEFLGVVYYLFGNNSFVNMTIAVFVNALAVGWATAMLYRLALAVSDDHRVAGASAMTFALFPGAIFFQSLPLKEGISVFAVTAIGWGLVQVFHLRSPKGWRAWLIGVLLIAGLRVYLVPVVLYISLLCLIPMPRRGLLSRVAVLTVWAALFALVALYSVRQAGVDISKHESLQYFDIDRLNETRTSLVRGSGAMYDDKRNVQFGDDPLHNLNLAVRGAFFFIVSVDLSHIRSTRQAAAVPEALLLLYALPSLFVGIVGGIRTRGKVILPVILLFFALLIVYSSASTNLGAMYRWRLQALPFLLILVFQGAALRRRGGFYWFINRFRLPMPERHVSVRRTVGS